MIKIKNTHIWVRNSIALGIIFITFGHWSTAQQNVPIIHANSKKVDIQDGDTFQKGVWTLSPEIDPDKYYSLPSEKTRHVTFYTDRDSISFEVEHNKSYDFLIVLNQKDTCHTRIVGGDRKKKIERKTLEPRELQEDLKIFVEALQREHGDITRYMSKDQLKGLCGRLFEKLNRPMDQFEFGTIVRYLISAVQNGHTGISLPSELMDYYREKIRMFPVQLWFNEETALVACNKYDNLPVGTEILSVNGVPINHLKERLFKYMKSDGKIATKKYWLLNYEGFPYLYSWVYGPANEYLVEYKTVEGITSTTTLQSDFIGNSQCLSFDRNVDKNLTIDFLKNNIALLTVRSFHSKELMRTGEDFQRFLATAFKEINGHKTKTLILDIRNNSGGDDAYGALLYSYLADRPFHFFPLESSGEEILPQKEWNFTGKIIFINNGLTFSTASNFAAIAQSNDRGVFIGEETGGAYYGGAAGETFTAVLPNSDIRITIPKDRYDNPVKPVDEEGRGVIPDYMVKLKLNDVIAKEDVQLKYALKLAKKP